MVFDRLPPAVRDRLTVGIVHGAPEPLLAAPEGRTPLALRGLSVVAIAAGLGVLGVAGWHFGDAHRPYALQPLSFTAVYGVLFAVLVMCGAGIARLRAFQRGAPFRSGRYLFALDLVEAAGGRLRVTSLDSLRRVEARPREVELVFADGQPVVFPVGKHDDAAALAERADKAIKAARALVYPANEVQLQRLDPFFEVRVTDDWDAAAAEPARSHPRHLVVALGGLLAAAPVGWALLSARNAVSDDMMFEEARTKRPGESSRVKLATYAAKGHRHLDEVARLLIEAAGDDRDALRSYLRRGGPFSALADDALFRLAENDLDALAAYMAQGGRHAEEADERLFFLASRLGTLAAWNTYLEVGKRHRDEVKKERLPDAEFAHALKSDLVGSLFSYVRRNPGSKHEDEAWRRIRAIYAEALPAFRAKSPQPADGTRFAEAMLAYLQDQADPRVTLEIEIIPGTAVAEADRTLAARYGARYLPAADYFSAAGLSLLSQDLRVAVNGWFGRAFPHGAAELARASHDDEGRPRIAIRCEAAVFGSTQWKAPAADSSEPDYVTPLVGFLVEVRAFVPSRDGKSTTTSWKLRVLDTSEGRMLDGNYHGAQRSRREMLEDAFSRTIDGTPGQIAASFDGKL